MIKRNFALTTVIVSVLLTIGLSGCAPSQPPPEASKTGIAANQSTATPNTNEIAAVTPPNAAAATAATVNTNLTANNSAAATGASAKPLPTVKAPQPVIGSGGDDFSLLVQARGALSADKELINAVIVEIKEGNITLTGSVASEAQKIRAGQLVQNVKGIKSIKNSLRVAS